MKKKLLSLALALVMCLGLTVSAFAEEADEKKEEDASAKVEETAAEEDKDAAEASPEDKDAGDAEASPEGENAGDAGDAAEGENAGDAEASPEGENAGDAETPAAPVNPFTDVVEASPFYSAILWAVDQGITNGTTPTTFGPGNTCTVSHILTFLWRANGRPGAAEGVADRDSAARWAVEQGMIPSASPDEFNVNGACNRGAAVTFMWIAAGKPEATSEKKFTDVPEENAELVSAIAWAFENGVTTGTGDGSTFSSANTCTRGQIVTFLYRADQAANAAE